jgi:hypothetical protein
VEVFQRITAAAGDTIEWLRIEQQGYEAILLVCGCNRACPEDDLQHISRVVTIKHNGLSPERVVAQILGKGHADANQD